MSSLSLHAVLQVGMAAGPGAVMARLMLQLAVIVVAAGLGGLVVRRFLKGPAVLGELLAGMVVGPYALGGVRLGSWGPLFPLVPGQALPVSFELYGIATLASVLLLFLSGLETDLKAFLRYSVSGSLVGVGGFVLSFLLGAWGTVAFGGAASLLSPEALFMGTVATATSVGLTARLLSERKKMSSPEGVTILAGAVFDDVLGIVLLAVVLGYSLAVRTGESMDLVSVARLTAKAVGFWAGSMVAGLLLARRFSRLVRLLRSHETMAAVCLGLALLLAGLAEQAGLAMIIGAYVTGLALSRTDLAYELQGQLRGLYTFLIPVFFCVMGMLVDFGALRGMLLPGLAYAVLAILGKLVGCGLPAWWTSFTWRGALRVGAGMIPRSEVALIIAGVGLASGSIGPDLFGVVIMMTLVSTLVAPPLLLKAFQGGSGVRGAARMPQEAMDTITLDFPSSGLAEFLVRRIARAFREEEFFVYHLPTEQPTYQVRKEDMAFTLRQEGSSLSLTLPVAYRFVGRMILLEELLTLEDLLDAVRRMKSPGSMGGELLSGLFRDEDSASAAPPGPRDAPGAEEGKDQTRDREDDEPPSPGAGRPRET